MKALPVYHTIQNPVYLTPAQREWITRGKNNPPCRTLEALASLCSQTLPGINEMPGRIRMPAYAARTEAIRHLGWAASEALGNKELIMASYRPPTHKSVKNPRYGLHVDNIANGVKLTMTYSSRSTPWAHWTNIADLIARAMKIRNNAAIVGAPKYVLTPSVARAMLPVLDKDV